MDQAAGQSAGPSVKLSNKIIVSSWMGDPMVSGCNVRHKGHGSGFFFFLLYTEFTSDVSQESGSKFLCFHGNVQFENRSSMCLNYSRTIYLLELFTNSF